MVRTRDTKLVWHTSPKPVTVLSRFGLPVKTRGWCWQTAADHGSVPLRLSFLFMWCMDSYWLRLSSAHSWNIKMTHTTAHLHSESCWWWHLVNHSVQFRFGSLDPVSWKAVLSRPSCDSFPFPSQKVIIHWYGSRRCPSQCRSRLVVSMSVLWPSVRFHFGSRSCFFRNCG